MGTYRHNRPNLLQEFKMFSYIWPLALVIVSNLVYQICAKSIPSGLNPFASLTVSYLLAAFISFLFYFLLNKDSNIFAEYRKLNWSSFLLGLSLLGMELGWIYAFKAGWEISTAQIIQSAILGSLLLLVGIIFFKEKVSWNKFLGIAICLVGLVVINIKIE